MNSSTKRSDAAERLRQAREAAGFSTPKEAAEALGVPYPTYYAHEKGSRGFGDLAEQYARRFKVNLSWLAFGTEPRVGKAPLIPSFDPDAPEPPPRPEIQPGGMKSLPEGAIAEIDLRPGAGGGGYASVVVDSEKTGLYPEHALKAEWVFPPSFVKDELGLSFGKAEILRVQGDSMYPDLSDGDRVICDRTDTKVNQGGIFAIFDGDAVIVKQVELVRDADRPRILCTSRNERYKPFTLDLNGDVFVIGRITAKIARM